MKIFKQFLLILFIFIYILSNLVTKITLLTTKPILQNTHILLVSITYQSSHNISTCFFFRYYQHLHTHNSTTLIVTFCMKVLVFWFGSVRPWVVIVLNYPPRVDIRCYNFVEQQHYQICSQLCHIYYILDN